MSTRNPHIKTPIEARKGNDGFYYSVDYRSMIEIGDYYLDNLGCLNRCSEDHHLESVNGNNSNALVIESSNPYLGQWIDRKKAQVPIFPEGSIVTSNSSGGRHFEVLSYVHDNRGILVKDENGNQQTLIALFAQLVVLKKGEKISFLGYTIRNCENNDGIVLSGTCGSLANSHLGNYGPGTQQSVDNAMQAAIIYYMLARPEVFSACLVNKIMGSSTSGTMHEYSRLEGEVKKDGGKMPIEITPGDGMNNMIYFKGKPLGWNR